MAESAADVFVVAVRGKIALYGPQNGFWRVSR